MALDGVCDIFCLIFWVKLDVQEIVSFALSPTSSMAASAMSKEVFDALPLRTYLKALVVDSSSSSDLTSASWQLAVHLIRQEAWVNWVKVSVDGRKVSKITP